MTELHQDTQLHFQISFYHPYSCMLSYLLLLALNSHLLFYSLIKMEGVNFCMNVTLY